MGNSGSSVLPGVVPEDVKMETFKIALIGPPTVGKSCIFKRYIATQFNDHYAPDLTANTGLLILSLHPLLVNVRPISPPIFISFSVPRRVPGAKFVGIDGLPTINLELWDIPGGLDPQLEDVYFENLDGVVLVFDVANAKQSSEQSQEWFNRVIAYEQRHELSPIPKVKFGNKRDLIHGVLWHHFDTSKVCGAKWHWLKQCCSNSPLPCLCESFADLLGFFLMSHLTTGAFENQPQCEISVVCHLPIIYSVGERLWRTSQCLQAVNC